MFQFKEEMKGLLFLWVRGVIVIAEIFLILFGLYWFNSWFYKLSDPTRMKFIWFFVIAFLAIPVPLILGAMAGISANASKVVRKVISVPSRKRTF